MMPFTHDKETLNEAIALALSKGGEYADFFFEDTHSLHVTYMDHKVDAIVSGKRHGVGLRVIQNGNTIYLFSNKTSKENLFALATKASAVIAEHPRIEVVRLDERTDERAHAYDVRPTAVALDEKVGVLREIDTAMSSVSKKITQCIAHYIEREKRILVATSDGTFATDDRVYVSYHAQAVASDGSVNQTGSRMDGALKGYEYIRALEPRQLGENAAKSAIEMLTADYPKPGVYPVVIGNGDGGVIFHEACGHGLEATRVAKGGSVFCGMMGKEIASPCLSAYDDGTLANLWGSYTIDDEGTPAQRTTLIKDGVLTSYLVDRLGSMTMEHALTGSSRRESYEYIPTSRMRNTFIAKGETEFDDLFDGIDEGVYVKRLGGGSVNPATSEFNFSVKEAYAIEKGAITKPLRGATLVGRGNEILMNIEKVGNDLDLAGGGYCGSISGGVPVTVGQPSIKVKGLVIGGRA